MYKCIECGHLFEDGEQATYRENQGECFGYPAYEEFNCCPVCKGDYEEAVQCEKCGEYFFEDELLSGICESCLDSSIDYNSAFDYIAERQELKEFIISYYEFLRKKGKDTDERIKTWFKRQVFNDKLDGTTEFLESLKEYIKSDIYSWSEYVAEEVKS